MPLIDKTGEYRLSMSNRQSLTMPDMSAMTIGKSASMTDIMQKSSTNESKGFGGYAWSSSSGGGLFSKSHSSAAIMAEVKLLIDQKAPARYTSELPVAHYESNLISPTDIEFDRKMEDQVHALDATSNEFVRITAVLDSIDHSRYLPNFIEHEIDYDTFLSLEDGDLKELGIKALGSRKKILAVIRECVEKVKARGE